MTLTLIFIAWLMMGLIFCLGYIVAMQRVLHHVQNKILPKTGEMLDEYKSLQAEGYGSALLGSKIDGRLEVIDELHDVLRPPFSKKSNETN